LRKTSDRSQRLDIGSLADLLEKRRIKSKEKADAKAEAKAEAEAKAKAEAEAKSKAKTEAGANDKKVDEAKARIERELQTRRSREIQNLGRGAKADMQGNKTAPDERENAEADHLAVKPPVGNDHFSKSLTREDEESGQEFNSRVSIGKKEFSRASQEKQEKLTTVRGKIPLFPKSKDQEQPPILKELAADISTQKIEAQQLMQAEFTHKEESTPNKRQAKSRKSFGQYFARERVSLGASDKAEKKIRGKLSGAKPSYFGAMIRATDLRTGIDIGSNSIKLVHGRGKDRLEEVMICAKEDLPPASNRNDEAELEWRTVEAFNKLLKKNDLNKRNMGRIIVSVSGRDASIREVEMAPLSEKDLQMALPFEAKTHLDIETMERPVLAAQILGEASALIENGMSLNRVLLVAVPTYAKNFPLRVLAKIGLEPRVLDLDLLAGLNQLFANLPAGFDCSKAVGLVDIGLKQSSLHITSHRGGILSRKLGFGAASPKASEETVDRFIDNLKLKMAETVFFYRQRFSKDIAGIYLSGGGALLEGLPEKLQDGIKFPVHLLDPTEGLRMSESASKEIAGYGPSFVNAMGLCRWGDAAHV